MELNQTLPILTSVEPGLKMHVQSLDVPSRKNWGPEMAETSYCRRISTTSQINGKFIGEYLRNEI